MWAAVELETIAKPYYHALLIGGPVVLPHEEIAGVIEGFATYGHQDKPNGEADLTDDDRRQAREFRNRHIRPFVIGGGINGAGIARDAAGRGLSVLLCEKDDLAQGTSSAPASSFMAAYATSNITSFAWCAKP